MRLIIDRFGIAAVRNAWYDTNKATEHDINGYTKVSMGYMSEAKLHTGQGGMCALNLPKNYM